MNISEFGDRMGTKVQNLPGYYSMRDLNEESSSCGWPLLYGDKALTNGQYYNNYFPGSSADAFSPYDKDCVKRMMLEHEAIFKNQVYELHRLYRIQRDLMNEVERKELHKNQIPLVASYSTGPLASQITTENGKKWHISGFPVGNLSVFPVGNPPCTKTSISGVEGDHSPLGSIKGISRQTDLFPSPNGCSSEDVEVLESRPSKVRRKTFDLHLPANEYIDPGESEKFSDEKISGATLFPPGRNCNNRREGDDKLFCGNGGKTVTLVDMSKSEQSVRRNGLADLNEPLQVDEISDSPYLLSCNPCQGTTECSDLSTTKQKSEFFGLSRENLLNSQHGTDSWARNNGYLENNGSGKGWIPSVAGAGHAKSNIQSVPQVLKLEKPLLSSQTLQDSHSKDHESGSDYLSGRSKADFVRERTISASESDIGERNHGYSINRHPGAFPVAPSSDLSKSWSYSASSSWEMVNGSLNQKLISLQTPPSLNASGALSRSSQSHQSNVVLEPAWPLNINSKPNQGFRCDIAVQNGFHPGSASSGSKEPSTNMSSISYDYLNHNNDCKIIPGQFTKDLSSDYHKGLNSNFNDMKYGKDIDLNVLLSNGSSSNLISQPGIGTMDGEQKHDEHHAMLPWLRVKTTCKTEVQNSDRCITIGDSRFSHVASKSIKDEIGQGPSGTFLHNIIPGSCSNDIETRRKELSENSSNKKILGVPIFDMPRISPKEFSSITSPSDIEAVEKNRRTQILDINLPCDVVDLELEKDVTETIVNKERSHPTEASSRIQIDLNLSMSEDEESLTTIPTTNAKTRTVIDLEAPALPETEEDEAVPQEKQLETSPASPQGPQDTVEQPQDELIRNAAEAIVVMSSLPCDKVDDVISSSLDSPMVDPLSWFADIISSSCKDNPEGKRDTLKEKDGDDNEKCSSEGMDHFESMTLKLPETKEEEYMPNPIVPENFMVEELAPSLPSRTRKGPTRRGRQRRDFQRDILPGLASLSRHEVTEDLQIFGGLMRATGHSWNSGLTRRSSSRIGGGRGRRKVQIVLSPPHPPQPLPTNVTCPTLIQQLNNIEMGLEDRSLTGWGKTTRRPRRQRCPAGNPPPSIPLT